MKNVFVTAVVFCSVALLSCKSRNENGKFQVSGKITDKSASVVNQFIYLKEVNFTNNEPVIIDSQKIATDGVYKLKSNIAGQHLYILTVNRGFPFLLINDDEDITYDINASDPLHPTVKGSNATNKLYEFINTYKGKDSALSNTAIALDSMNKLPTTTHSQDSIMEVLVKNKKSQTDEINSGIKDFVNNADNPILALYVMAFMAPRTLEPKELLPVAQSVSDRFKEDGSIAAFLSQVKQAAAGDDGNYNQNFKLLNQSAPDLAMMSPDGKPVKISDFKGKYLLVDFWASWCGPCRAENPNVVKVYNKFKDKNFTILGVSLDQDKDAWIKAIQHDKLTWHHMSDLKQWESAAVQTYHFDAIPFNILLDPSGKIIAANLRGDDLDTKLGQLFNANNVNSIDSTKTEKS